MKFCPLCGDGYQDWIGRCKQCNALLVPSLEADDVRENAPCLLWKGRDFDEFDAVAGALRDAGVPARTLRGMGGLAGTILRTPSTIHVLAADLEQAIKVVVESLADRRAGPQQICYRCSTGCSEFLAVCPACRARLIVEPARTDAAAISTPSERKYCPLCNSEYSSSHEKCYTCGVALVPEESRGVPLSEAEKHDPLEIIWRGGDPAALSTAVALLREAGIRHHVQSSSDYLVFGLAMPQPKYNLRVLRSDAERAKQLLAEVQETPFFSAEISPDFPRDAASRRESPATSWNPAAATTQLWFGEDAAFAGLLEACLRENRIGVLRQGREPGPQRLLVQSSDASRAREILREIVEGKPLE